MLLVKREVVVCGFTVSVGGTGGIDAKEDPPIRYQNGTYRGDLTSPTGHDHSFNPCFDRRL